MYLLIWTKESIFTIFITSVPLTPSLPFKEILLLPEGLNPYIPQNDAGILAEPAESVQTAKAHWLVETAVPSPPELPPLINPFFQGFFEQPYTWLLD